ncbi:MAG TPA: hypothetical protein VFJ58_12855 [Armatimonadota bacterium]|nr:hypothetical protein [Armatimonadota bacterium]
MALQCSSAAATESTIAITSPANNATVTCLVPVQSTVTYDNGDTQ